MFVDEYGCIYTATGMGPYTSPVKSPQQAECRDSAANVSSEQQTTPQSQMQDSRYSQFATLTDGLSIVIGAVILAMLYGMLFYETHRAVQPILDVYESDSGDHSAELVPSSSDWPAWRYVLDGFGLSGVLEISEGFTCASRGLTNLSHELPRIVGSGMILYYMKPLASLAVGFTALR